MSSLLPDILVTRKAIARLIGSLSGDAAERAEIAATAAWLFVALDQGDAAADAVFRRCCTSSNWVRIEHAGGPPEKDLA